MNPLKSLLPAAAIALFLAGAAGAADHVTSRTLAQLKAEVIRRASEVRSLEVIVPWMTKQLRDRPATARARD